MRITYVTQTRFPTEKAHGFQIAQVCDALAKLGHDVTLLAPTVRNSVRQSAAAYYGLRDSFRVVNLRQFDALGSRLVPEVFAFAISMHFYRRALRRHLKDARPDLLYARSAAVLPALLETGIPVVLELHTIPRRRGGLRELCDRCALVVCLTTPMRDELLSLGVNGKRVTVEPDGVDPERFASLPEPIAAAKHWKLPHGRTIVGYVGSLVTHDTLEKGAGELLPAVAELKKRGQPVAGWIVGGPKEWLDRYRARAKELGLTDQDFAFHEPIPAASVPTAIAAMDVCVYPAPKSDHPFFRRDTSPLKLLEYLAAGRPTVCAEIPPVRDIADEDAALFYEPGDIRSLADAVTDVIDRPEEAMGRAEHARRSMQRFAWVRRMERIVALAKPAKKGKKA